MIRRTTGKKEILSLASDCRQCGKCCTFDSGIFLDEDVARAAAHEGIAEPDFRRKFLVDATIYNRHVHKAKLRAKPFGPCIFLKNWKCSIQDAKPLHCRLCNPCSEHGEELSQWFMLNYIVDPSDPFAAQEWEHYAKGKKVIER